MENNRTNKAEWKTYILRDYGLTDQERERREEIIDNLADALDAATRGGDYSSPIQYLADKYGTSKKDFPFSKDPETDR